MRKGIRIGLVLVGVIGSVAAGVAEWRRQGPYGAIGPPVTRGVDAESGFEVVAFSSRGYGPPDTWCVMDGARVVRVDIDDDRDGVVDTREVYGPDGTVQTRVALHSSGRTR